MSEGNITKYKNDTGFIDAKRDSSGLTFIQTLILTLCVITWMIILFTATVYYLMRKKLLDELRHRLLPLYHFDPAECEDWEDELVEDSERGSTKNRVHFYRSMSTPIVTTEH